MFLECFARFRGRRVSDTKFFDERTDQSEVKARIVQKYFFAWANVIMPSARHPPHRRTRRLVERTRTLSLWAAPERPTIFQTPRATPARTYRIYPAYCAYNRTMTGWRAAVRKRGSTMIGRQDRCTENGTARLAMPLPRQKIFDGQSIGDRNFRA